ncbi:MAG: hypothetical protein UX51_C0050G0006 [Candidatus Azambacteria bacterium GW2011_GWF2_46_32]|uniref:Uncharacterized protein n=1 Tax=Candidatus Azambacteria bacterium GW2011_GWF2_46_32 TaxID=1618628 RepID=A0A0G1SSZ2_9BACT|nr:MAG: hypothetical protein UX51_C0050G0006 [Candidatus Azambacteria bacterium GW2011_GWF2_46_32]
MHTKQFFFYKIVVNGLFDHRLNNLRRFFGRNFDAESGAFGDLAFKRNLPSEIIHDHFNDKKSESGAAFFGVIREKIFGCSSLGMPMPLSPQEKR